MSTEAVRPMMLVSACLLGCRARYDAVIVKERDERLQRWWEAGLVLPFCPETAGGLPTPRAPAEIRGGRGQDVLAGNGKVFTGAHLDVTDNFITGARLTLAAVRRFSIHIAVLKDGSPSCGTTRIYDGCFRGRTVPGQGVTAALLAGHGVTLFNERDLSRLAYQLARSGFKTFNRVQGQGGRNI